MSDESQSAGTATPQQFRDSMPFFGLMAAKVTQTQAFHYPRG